MPGPLTTTHVRIASGQTVSAEVDLRGKRLLAVQTPGVLTGVTLSFQAAERPVTEGGVYTPVTHMNTLAVTATTLTSVAASQHIVVQGALLPGGLGNCMLRLVSGSAEEADREFVLFTSP